MRFSNVQLPDDGLLSRRNDPHDPRLGECIGLGWDDYPAARVVLLGCPQDEGVLRNGGRPGARLAPNAIRRCLYRLTNNSMEQLRLVDLGDLVPATTLEETHERLGQVAEAVLRDGKTLLVLGGGNDISYPDARALSRAVNREILVLNVDAHFDVRADTPRNSGTPYRQLLDEGWVRGESFFELGSEPQCNSRVYTDYLEAQGVTVVPRATWRAQGIVSRLDTLLAQPSRAIFAGLDLDVVNASEAPGVSAPNPLGLTGTELCEVATRLGAEPRVRLLELTEVNPEFDLDQHTARLAATVLWHFLQSREIL